jgi:hypothetical protein
VRLPHASRRATPKLGADRALLAAAIAATAVSLAGATGATPAAPPPITGWLTFGNGPARQGTAGASLDDRSLRPSWFADLDGTVTT